MSSRDCGQEGERGTEMFEWSLANLVPRTRKKISGQSGQGGKQVREMFESEVAAEVAWAMKLICGESVQEGEQKWWFEKAVAMAVKKHFDERIEGEKQEMEMIERAATMAMKIIQSYCPLPVEASSGTVPFSDELATPRIGGSFVQLEQTPHASPPFPSYSSNGGNGVPGGAPSHQNIRVGESSAAAHIRSITGAAGPNIQALDPTGSIHGSAAGAREYGGSQTVSLDESRGPSVAISMPPPQQGDQGFVANRRNGKDDPGKVVQNALVSAFGGVVVLCFSTLDNTLKENCPGYVRATMYAWLVVIAGTTFVGLISNKRTKAAFKVVASAAVAAVSTAVVINVSENVYIKATCVVLGALATLATAAIHW